MIADAPDCMNRGVMLGVDVARLSIFAKKESDAWEARGAFYPITPRRMRFSPAKISTMSVAR